MIARPGAAESRTGAGAACIGADNLLVPGDRWGKRRGAAIRQGWGTHKGAAPRGWTS